MSHVTQTDHRVIRSGEQITDHGIDHHSDELSLFDASDLRLDPWERDRALYLGAWIYLSKSDRQPPRELARFLLRVLDNVPEDGLVLVALGSMADANQFTDHARDYYERAQKIAAAEEDALSGLLNIDYRSSDWEKALACAVRLIEINPGSARVHALHADILTNLGKRSEGVEAAKRALEFNPTLVPVRQWLVNVYRDSGRIQEQREQEQIIRRMQDARPPREDRR